MVRTQIQIPDDLYRQLKRIAEAKEWSLAEVIRRGAEYAVQVYGHATSSGKNWAPPQPRPLGQFRTPVEQWRELANIVPGDEGRKE